MKHETALCGLTRENSAPQSLIEANHIRFPAAYREAGEMARLSALLREGEGSPWCTLPHCSTVEAEALGARICLGDRWAGPRAEAMAVQRVSELMDLPTIDPGRGCIAQVLSAAQTLAGSGHPVVLNVEGAFTILDYLMPAGLTYRALARRDPQLLHFLDRLRGELVGYLRSAGIHGVGLISLADPTGNPALVGERLFADMTECFTLPLLRDSEAAGAPAIHLCPQLYRALVRSGAVGARPAQGPPECSYGETLLREVQSGASPLLGGGCIHRWDSPVGALPLHIITLRKGENDESL